MPDDDMTVEIPVTEAERKLLEQRAAEGKTLDEWASAKLASIAAANPDYQTVLAEVRGLRRLLEAILSRETGERGDYGGFQNPKPN